MTEPSDDPLDALLQAAFDGPVPADDFCARVMARLPARPRRFRAWPTVAGIVAGVATCVAGLHSMPALRSAWQVPEPSSSTMILLAIASGMSMIAAAWALAEPDPAFQRSG